MLRIISLNLNGIRSAWSKNVLPWAAAHKADVICLQELKAQHPDLTSEMRAPDGMHAYYHCAEKKGYSGVGIWSRREPDRVVEGFYGGECDDLPAVKSREIYGIYHGGNRTLSDFVYARAIAKALYPDAFADVDPAAELAEYYKTWMPIAAEGLFVTKLK